MRESCRLHTLGITAFISMYRTDNFMPSVHAELQRMSRDDDMRCPRCQESYAAVPGRIPRVLACLHGVCSTCAEEEGGLQDFRCPTCLVEDVRNVSAPTDYPRLNQLMLHEIEHRPEQVVCGYRRDGGRAKRYCFPCGHFLCSQCARFHSEMELAKEHKTVEISGLLAYTLDEWRPTKRCLEHPDYPVTSYCRESGCRKLVCLFCSTTEHAEHYTQRIDDAYETERNNLKNVCQQLTNMIPALKARRTRTKKAEDQRERIRASFDKLRVTVTERHEHHRQILDQHYGEYHAGAEESQRKLRDDLKAATVFYDQAMAFRSDPSYRDIEGNIQQMEAISVPKNPDSQLVFVQVGLANILQGIRSYGKLNTSVH